MIIGIDPSLDCTAWAALSDDGKRFLKAGTCSAGKAGEPLVSRLLCLTDTLLEQIISSIDCRVPLTFVIETPAEKVKGRRSSANLPGYGAAVGAVIIAIRENATFLDRKLIGVTATQWTRTLDSRVRATAADAQKAARVEYVCMLYAEVSPELLGTKKEAGNVADAILIARWWAAESAAPTNEAPRLVARTHDSKSIHVRSKHDE